MTELTPKQLEIRGRERLILDSAFELHRDGGMEAIRLDSIAERVGCTRGTLYNHFKNREEILVAMASRAVNRRIGLFEYGISLGTTTRERLSTVCLASMIFCDEMPGDFDIEQAIRHDPIWQKTSSERRELFRGNEKQCMQIVGAMIDAAIHQRDLPLPAGIGVEQMIERVAFGLWSLVYGGLLLEATSPSLAECGIRDPRNTIHHNCNSLLDHFGWTPLYDPIAYQAFIKRVVDPLRTFARKMATSEHAMISP